MIQTIRTSIIPNQAIRVGVPDKLDLKAICVYTAIGFFLGEDTFYEGLKTLKPGSEYILDGSRIVSHKPYFAWHNTPQVINLQEATEAFKGIFDELIRHAVNDRRVILPLSGGLDSRTLAAGLKHANANVTAYSYSFEGGLNEARYAQKIADAEKYPFHKLQIPSGYLWSKIDELAATNACYSEFTHPRQMAFTEKYAAWGDVFLLGHWGDVLFDNMHVADNLPLSEQVTLLLKKVVKMGGMELGGALWQAWGIEGSFEDYLYSCIHSLLLDINIPNANAQLRAFKSRYWATRWTSVNLSIFQKIKPIEVPYFSNELCSFICTLPESILAKRQIQIEYLKQYAPELAQIEWQEKRPFNLYNYHHNYPFITLPYRGIQKIKRMLQKSDFIQRNWELQFLGSNNQQQLEDRLFNNAAFANWVPKTVVQNIYHRFKQENPVYYAHAVSMLLTLSLFSKQNKL
jgi:hypothetical protein